MKLLLVDDHPLFGIGLAHALRLAASDVEVRTAETIEEGIASAVAWPELDIVLIDYRLKHDDGLDGVRRFGARCPLVARVLISGDEEPALAMQARQAGASSFLGKSLTIESILSALQRILQGGVIFDVHSLRSTTAAVAAFGLTPRQVEVLALVAQDLPNKRIADELGVAERTVKLHVTALLERLEARNRTHLLIVAREKGLL